MSTWGELIEAGYSRVFGVTIEGIPFAFIETKLLTTEDEEIDAPAGYSLAPSALRVRGSDKISKELDRQTGLGRGRALDLVFALDALQAAQIDLFRTPTARAKLTVDATGTATSFTVEDTAGFSNQGGFYIGREFCTYTSITPTSFSGITRAVAGWAHYHRSNTASGYRFCTNRPQYWRGRLVTIYEHLVGPDGRALSSVACSVGSYCRQLWKGYVDAIPQIDGRQMLLRCLPIERLLAQELNGSAKGKVIFHPLEDATASSEPFGRFPVVVLPSDTVFCENKTTGDNFTVSLLEPPISSPMLASVDGVAMKLYLAVKSGLGASFKSGQAKVYFDEGELPRIKFRIAAEDPANTYNEMVVTPNVWFLSSEGEPTIFTNNLGADIWNGQQFNFRLNLNQSPNPWIVVKQDLEADGEPATWPDAGYALLENGEGLEVTRFKSVYGPASWLDGQAIYLQLTERALQGTTRINPFLASTLVTVIPGARGTLEEIIETLATSSGTGLRGPYDTLGYGLGLSIPGDWFSLSGWPVSSQWVDGASDDKASIEKVTGGWLALFGRCLTQRRGSDGYVRIEAVSTSLDVPGTVTALTEGDILVGSTQTERLFESPNVIRIEDSLRQKRTVSVVRDVPRQQSEGARVATFVAPGINTASALALATKMLALSDGQLVVTMAVRPGLELQVGDPCKLSLDHPAVWSWADGGVDYVLPARVIGESDSLGTGERLLTFLVPAQQVVARQLCPAARVDGYLSSTVISVDDVTGFEPGMLLLIYRRGNLSGTAATRTVSAVDPVANTITLTATLSSVTYPADGDTWMTYQPYNTGTAAQNEHLYVSRGSFEA